MVSRQRFRAFSEERKSVGDEVPVVRRSVSVNVTDAVTQSITDDVGMSGCRPSKGCSVLHAILPIDCRFLSLMFHPPCDHHCPPSIWTWTLDRSKGSRFVLSTRVSQTSAADSWCAPFHTSATRDPTTFPTPNSWWDTGPSHRRVLGRAWER
jgi:hypothetical protein